MVTAESFGIFQGEDVQEALEDPKHGLVGQASCLFLNDRQDACPTESSSVSDITLGNCCKFALKVARSCVASTWSRPQGI
jgi:hypothetical protein